MICAAVMTLLLITYDGRDSSANDNANKNKRDKKIARMAPIASSLAIGLAASGTYCQPNRDISFATSTLPTKTGVHCQAVSGIMSRRTTINAA